MTRRPLAPWQVLERRTVVNQRYLTVHVEHVRLSNGFEIPEFQVVESPEWVGVVPVTEQGEIVLVRQYRHGLRGESLELPAGMIEPDESPLQAAHRELREETGYASDDWRPLVRFAPEPARHTVKAHFFCALGARRLGEHSQDASEQIELVTVPRAELLALVEAGGIVHGVHVGAILLAERLGLLSGE